MPYPTRIRRFRHGDIAIAARKGGDTDGNARVDLGRGDLLARIGDFVARHRLSVTGSNLAIICNALAGADADLSRVIALRESAGEPIDQRWLDTLARFDPATKARMSELEKLSDQLEDALVRFAQTTKSAQDQTSDGREALDAQLTQFEASIPPSQKGREMDRVIDLSRAMLKRIEQVESAMARSQAETTTLRENLAKARREADVDHLTRLPNRRAFERRFAAAVIEARAKGEPLCVAFCDVDHFKAVNDTHGHAAGDRILRAIAANLSQIANDDCFVARHGGEEFVLLFFGLDQQAAWLKLDRARRTVAQRQMINRDTGKPFGKITFSAGLAALTEDRDARSVLARADQALYLAKEQGRNRIVTG